MTFRRLHQIKISDDGDNDVQWETAQVYRRAVEATMKGMPVRRSVYNDFGRCVDVKKAQKKRRMTKDGGQYTLGVRSSVLISYYY